MPGRSWRSICALALIAGGVAALVTQALAPTQPNLLTIDREPVTIGHDASHVKTEAGWPARYAHAKSPDDDLALVAVPGSAEVWSMPPRDSCIGWGTSMERDSTPCQAGRAGGSENGRLMKPGHPV